MQIIKASDLEKDLKKYYDFSQFDIDDDFLTLKHGNYSYEIPIIELKNIKQSLFWIRQVEQKTWVNREEFGKFINIVCDLNGI